MGVDAIRIDTLKHIERDELLTYVHDWQAHKPGLFVFGENLVKGTGWGSELANDNASAVIRPWWYTRTTPNPADPRAGAIPASRCWTSRCSPPSVTTSPGELWRGRGDFRHGLGLWGCHQAHHLLPEPRRGAGQRLQVPLRRGRGQCGHDLQPALDGAGIPTPTTGRR